MSLFYQPEGQFSIWTRRICRERKKKKTYPDKRPNFANGGRNTIVHAADTCGGRLGGQKTNVVTRSELAKGQEDTVDNGEAGDILGLCEVVICARHGKAKDSL